MLNSYLESALQQTSSLNISTIVLMEILNKEFFLYKLLNFTLKIVLIKLWQNSSSSILSIL